MCEHCDYTYVYDERYKQSDTGFNEEVVVGFTYFRAAFAIDVSRLETKNWNQSRLFLSYSEQFNSLSHFHYPGAQLYTTIVEPCAHYKDL